MGDGDIQDIQGQHALSAVTHYHTLFAMNQVEPERGLKKREFEDPDLSDRTRKERRIEDDEEVFARVAESTGVAALLSVANSDRRPNSELDSNGCQPHGAIGSGNQMSSFAMAPPGKRIMQAHYKGVPESVLASSTSTFSARLQGGPWHGKGAEGKGVPYPGVMIVGGSRAGGKGSAVDAAYHSQQFVPHGVSMGMPIMMGSSPYAPAGTQIMTVVPTPLPKSDEETMLKNQSEAIQTYRPTMIAAPNVAPGFVQISAASGNPPPVFADAEKMQHSMDVRTRVTCTGSATGRDGGFSSQKLWKKYGEKIVQPGRNKQPSDSSNETAKQWCAKRSYFRCYNKICPARMTVDVLLETGEQLAPVGSGVHTHLFEIIRTKEETAAAAVAVAAAAAAATAAEAASAAAVSAVALTEPPAIIAGASE